MNLVEDKHLLCSTLALLPGAFWFGYIETLFVGKLKMDKLWGNAGVLMWAWKEAHILRAGTVPACSLLYTRTPILCTLAQGLVQSGESSLIVSSVSDW